MPITVGFTLTSMVAVVLLVICLGVVRRRSAAYFKAGRNGEGRRVVKFLIRVIGARLFSSLTLVIAGGGVLTGYRVAGWLIALLPVGYVVVTIADLRFLLEEDTSGH